MPRSGRTPATKSSPDERAVAGARVMVGALAGAGGLAYGRSGGCGRPNGCDGRPVATPPRVPPSPPRGRCRRPHGVLDAPPHARRGRRRGWFKARFNEPPIRPTAAPTLRHEGGGRLDRLDLFLVVLLILGTMLLRTFRLAEPYQMHFDEVYHARTATEFLQAWRYGISHDIYEWTHPHVAKYLMAGGLVASGDDKVKPRAISGSRSWPPPSSRAASTRPLRAEPPASDCTSPPGPRSGPTTS